MIMGSKKTAESWIIVDEHNGFSVSSFRYLMSDGVGDC